MAPRRRILCRDPSLASLGLLLLMLLVLPLLPVLVLVVVALVVRPKGILTLLLFDADADAFPFPFLFVEAAEEAAASDVGGEFFAKLSAFR